MNKPIPIVVQIIPDAELWLRQNVKNASYDHVQCVHPVQEINLDGETEYYDREEDKSKKCTLDDHIKALQKLAETVGVSLFVGGIRSPAELVDTCNWDVEVWDAFFQLVMLGEVIYG